MLYKYANDYIKGYRKRKYDWKGYFLWICICVIIFIILYFFDKNFS